MTDELRRYELMKINGGEPAKEVTQDRFWYLLEVLYPENWHRSEYFECFMVSECITSDLHTWCARLDDAGESRYFELVTTCKSTPDDIKRLVMPAFNAGREFN